jgi:class 3 adenylate cyclase
MKKTPLQEVRESLQVYATRGVFRGFSEEKSGQFLFVWLLRREMELIADTEKHVLRFRQLLPGIPTASELYGELKTFLAERHDEDLPEHRRIDRARAVLSCTNQRGAVTIALKVKNDDYAYGVNRLVNLVHELFLYLREHHTEYLVENFDVPQE